MLNPDRETECWFRNSLEFWRLWLRPQASGRTELWWEKTCPHYFCRWNTPENTHKLLHTKGPVFCNVVLIYILLKYVNVSMTKSLLSNSVIWFSDGSINPSIFIFEERSKWQQAQQGVPDDPLPQTLPDSPDRSWRIPRSVGIENPYSSSESGKPSMGGAQEELQSDALTTTTGSL